MKRRVRIAIVLFVLGAITACRTDQIRHDNRLSVVTTLFPVYDMARSIGGERVSVSLLLPPGVEAHAFEPRPSDIKRINESDIFIYTDRFMEPWVDKLTTSVINNRLLVLESGKGIPLLPAVFHDADEPAGSPDPHIWLDFENAQIMVRNITGAFIDSDREHAAFYQRNAEAYEKRLADLDDRFRAALATCSKKEIIYSGHYAFGYLAKRYGLKYLAAQGASPNAEPTAKDLVRLVDRIRKDRIAYVFYEELASPKIAETLARETNTKMLLLNAGHNVTREQLERGVTFFDLMNADLKNLQTGLECMMK
jgi:zinc transport system substrate-binding protein